MSSEPHIDPYRSLADFFAYELRRCRESEGLSQSELAADALTTRACVSAYENRSRRPGQEFAQASDKRFGTLDRFQIINHHARREHKSIWLDEFVVYEQAAYSVKVYQSGAVHTFLQTEPYARAVLAAGAPLDPDGVVAARLARGEIIARTSPAPPEYCALLDQAVLLRRVGGIHTMRAQLLHLLTMSDIPNVTIQVVPFTAGAHWGLNGELTLLGLDEGDMAYTEAQKGGRLIEDPAEVRELAVRYDRIRAKALSEDDSRDLIAEMVRTMR